MRRRWLLIPFLALVAVGGFIASVALTAPGDVHCNSATATATTPDHVIGVDGSPVSTVPGASGNAIATACITEPAASTVTVTVGTTTTPTGCSSSQYSADYFNNITLSGTPVLHRCDTAPLAFNWGFASPGPGVNADNFSVRWTGSFSFPGGSTLFTARTDDGMRLYLDGVAVIDSWRNQAATTYQATRDVTAGDHTIRVEFYDATEAAVMMVSWVPVAPPPPPPPPPPPGVTNFFSGTFDCYGSTPNCGGP